MVGLCCAKKASERDKLTTKTDEQRTSNNTPRFGSRIKLDNQNNGIKTNNNEITSNDINQIQNHNQNQHNNRHHLTNHNWNSSWQLTSSHTGVSQKRTTSELNLTSSCPLENARTREQLLIDKTRSSVKAMY